MFCSVTRQLTYSLLVRILQHVVCILASCLCRNRGVRAVLTFICFFVQLFSCVRCTLVNLFLCSSIIIYNSQQVLTVGNSYMLNVAVNNAAVRRFCSLSMCCYTEQICQHKYKYIPVTCFFFFVSSANFLNNFKRCSCLIRILKLTHGHYLWGILMLICQYCKNINVYEVIFFPFTFFRDFCLQNSTSFQNLNKRAFTVMEISSICVLFFICQLHFLAQVKL